MSSLNFMNYWKVNYTCTHGTCIYVQFPLLLLLLLFINVYVYLNKFYTIKIKVSDYKIEYI